MRILFYNPAPNQRRYIPFEAIKGSAFFRRPNYDAMRLSYLSSPHDFYYYDEWIEDKPNFTPDILVVNAPLNLARYLESTIKSRWGSVRLTVGYGIYPTIFPEKAGKFFDVAVIGDIGAVWKKILDDFQKQRPRQFYESPEPDQFNVDRKIESKYGFTPVFSQLRTTMGCRCISEQKDYCYENVLYKSFKQWASGEVVDEVTRLKRKIIFVQDDDFLADVDYAIRVLEKCWRHKKMWIFQTTSGIFNNPHILSFLRDDGVRIIYLKEDWLGSNLVKDLDSKSFVKEKKNQVGTLHNHRIAVACKIRVGFEHEDYQFYKNLLKFLTNIRIDLIEVAAQTPLPKTALHKMHEKAGWMVQDLSLYDQWMPVVQIPGVEPHLLYSWMEWLRDRFYSWDSIFNRSIHTSPQLGVYNTTVFYLVPNLSYRNNFLEKIGYPP